MTTHNHIYEAAGASGAWPFSGQRFDIPTTLLDGVVSVDMTGGAGNASQTGNTPGNGARLSFNVAATPGDFFTVFVGAQGSVFGLGAFLGGGGGLGDSFFGNGGTGGAASSFVDSSGNILAIAGGGAGGGAGTVYGFLGLGGAAYTLADSGASGAAPPGGANPPGGQGASGSIAGNGGFGVVSGGPGNAPTTGTFPGFGGQGGSPSPIPGTIGGGGGGGGGGGYAGGGGGAGDTDPSAGGGGGGGGSSWASSRCTAILHTKGYQSGHGYCNVGWRTADAPLTSSALGFTNALGLASSIDATIANTLEFLYNNATDSVGDSSGTITAYIMRIKKTSASAYSYFNAYSGTLSPPQRVDAATVTSGSATVLDASIQASDAGAALSSGGIALFVGWGAHAPVVGVSFTSVNSSNVPVNAAASGSSVTLGGPVVNPVSLTPGMIPSNQVTVTLPANLLANSNEYQWSIAAQGTYYNLQGPFASDVLIGTAASVSVNVSVGGTEAAGIWTVQTSTPIITWAFPQYPPTTLSVATGTSPITTLHVPALAEQLYAGTQVTVIDPSNPLISQTFTLTANAPATSTTLTVSSATPLENFPIGSSVTVLPQTEAQVFIYTLAQTQMPNFLAGAFAENVYNTALTGSTQGFTVPSSVGLLNDETYVVYVSAQLQGALVTPYGAATVAIDFDAPALPVITDTGTNDSATNMPINILTAQGYDNLLDATESSFESGIGGWGAIENCTGSLSTVQALDGIHSLALTSAGGTMQAQSGHWAVAANQSIFGLASFRAGSAVSRQCQVGIAFYDVTNTLIEQFFGDPQTEGHTGWVGAAVLAIAPSTATTASLVVQVAGTAAAEVSYVDCAALLPAGFILSNNMLPTDDANFENSLGGWGNIGELSNCALVRTNLQALEGAWSVQMTAASAGNMIAGSPLASVIPSQPITVLAAVKAHTTARSVTLRVPYFAADGVTQLGEFDSPSGVRDVNTGWTLLSASGILPAGAYQAGAWVEVDGVVTSEVHYVDAVAIFLGSTATGWSDGWTPPPWSLGGFVGNSTFQVQASDDQINWTDLPNSGVVYDLTQLATITDYWAPNGSFRYYRGRTVSVAYGQVVQSDWVELAVTPLPNDLWWIVDPTDPSLDTLGYGAIGIPRLYSLMSMSSSGLQVSIEVDKTEDQGVFQAVGDPDSTVVRGVMRTECPNQLNLFFDGEDLWSQFDDLRSRQRTLLLKSDMPGVKYYVALGGSRPGAILRSSTRRKDPLRSLLIDVSPVSPPSGFS